MYVTVVTLSCDLLAQAGADVPLVSVEPAENQASTAAPASEAADLVAAALTLPEGAAVTGEPMTLLQALSSVRGTQGRLEVPHAYWRLTLAVAEYCSHFEENDRLHRIEVRPEDGMLLETAGASAAAELRMAELRMVSAQHDLAEAVMLPATASLPLPADRPLVGVYLTKFEEVRRARQLPDLARLIDRSLPIRRQVIEVRTSAVRASQDVLEAKYDAYHLGKADFNEVLLSLRQWGAQHRAFLGTVFNYNHDIADYALSVADPQMEERVVVAMLIRPSEEPAQIPIPEADSDQMGQPTDVRKPSAVRPADYNAPVRGKGVGEPDSTPSAGPLQPTGRKMPTLAPPRGAEESGHTGEGLSATSSDGWEKSATVAPVPSPPADEAEPEGAESGQVAEVAEAPKVPV
ncbi:MAG: hypothetical protein HQ582_25725, partial [Planctomycetes bacterium]|nr:hypothetical protein [Planctomycetota bacterium]